MPLIALVHGESTGLDKQQGLPNSGQRRVLEKKGLHGLCPQRVRPWSEREARLLRRDGGKPGRSLRTIAANLGRTWQEVGSKAARFERAA
jgi:hypothetical protein